MCNRLFISGFETVYNFSSAASIINKKACASVDVPGELKNGEPAAPCTYPYSSTFAKAPSFIFLANSNCFASMAPVFTLLNMAKADVTS